MIAAKQGELNFPLRWWSFGRFGVTNSRKRTCSRILPVERGYAGCQFTRSGCELIAVAAAFLRSVGMNPQQATIFVNDRRLMDSSLTRLALNRLGVWISPT